MHIDLVSNSSVQTLSLTEGSLGFNVFHCLSLDIFNTESVAKLSFEVQIPFEEKLHLLGRQIDVDYSLEYLPG